jgi:maleate isomerase
MTGDSTRLGVVVPSSNTTVEREFAAALDDDVSLHVARMPLENVTVDELDAMADDATAAADRLADANVDVVAYACTTGSLIHGHGFDAELEERLADITGVPAVATARSVKRALAAVDATAVALVTPYTADLNEREVEFLDAAGIDVALVDGLGIESNASIGALTATDAARQVRDAIGAGGVREPRFDAVFVSCTNYATLELLPALEREFEVPVVSSNAATVWDALGAVDEPTDCVPGRLGGITGR